MIFSSQNISYYSRLLMNVTILCYKYGRVYHQQYNISEMTTASFTSSYDVVVIKHKNNILKSTQFQTVFSEKVLSKKINRQNLQLYVNEQLIEVPMRLNPQNARVQFQKKYVRNTQYASDNSDFSDDQRSVRSVSRQKRLSGSSLKGQSIQQLTNQTAPKNFWQFAWLFNSKTNRKSQAINVRQTKPIDQPITQQQHKLAKIKQQPYQGQLSSRQPLFQLSLCFNTLIKKRQKGASKQQLQKVFYDNLIQYKDFIKDPLNIIKDVNLMMRIDNSLLTWQLGAAVLACRFAFGVDPQRSGFVESIKAKSKKSWFSMGRDNMTCIDIQKQPPALKPVLKLQEQQIIIKYRKAPDSQLLHKMKLKYGQNKAKLILDLGPNKKQQTQFKIFLWDESQKIVVSDIDGTITKSDVMGQLKTNYIHKGVCLLYNQLYKRNYKILYMTARAINQYSTTRRFLQTEAQQNGVNLPPGPLLMSPDGYMKSLVRQVIDKTPDQLKFKLLASINQIFPNSNKPIIAGFGNRQTDSLAYLRIKIPPQKIFCISQKSLISNQSDKDFSTSYTQMLQKVQEYFPHLPKKQSKQTSLAELSSKQGNKNADLINESAQQQQMPVTRRKFSHSQYLSGSRIDSQGKTQFFTISSPSRAKSQEGDSHFFDPETQSMFQEYMNKAMQNQLQKKKQE